MLKLLWHKIKQQKFVLSFGQEGAVLVLLKKNKVVTRLFANSLAKEDRKKFDTLLGMNPEVPLYILCDSMEQVINEQEIPGVGMFTVGKVVERRMAKEFAETDIKGAIKRARKDTGKKNWVYTFAATPLSQEVDQLLDYVLSLPNPYAGFFMLSIEVENMVKHFNKRYFQKEAKPAPWQFLVLHQKIGGFRQVVLHDGQVMFSRYIHEAHDETARVKAGNIEQEISNSLDYIRRLSFGGDAMDIIIIVSDEIKESLTGDQIKGYNTIIQTPMEVAELTKMRHSVTEKDRYGDILVILHFLSKPLLRLQNATLKKLDALFTVTAYASYVMFISLPILLIVMVYYSFHMYSNYSEVGAVELEKEQLEKQLQNISKAGEFETEDAIKIRDFVALNDHIEQYTLSPLSMIRSMGFMHKYDALANSLSWQYKFDLNSDRIKRGSKSTPQVELGFNMYWFNTGSSIESLFQKFDIITESMKREFGDFEVTHSKLPEKIDLETAEQMMTIDVRVVSKQ